MPYDFLETIVLKPLFLLQGKTIGHALEKSHEKFTAKWPSE